VSSTTGVTLAWAELAASCVSTGWGAALALGASAFSTGIALAAASVTCSAGAEALVAAAAAGVEPAVASALAPAARTNSKAALTQPATRKANPRRGVRFWRVPKIIAN
jgi:hypothetical protein